MIISAWWLQKSSKFSGKKSKNWKTLKWITPKQVWIRPKCRAPPSLSCDRRIKMKQNKQQTIRLMLDTHSTNIYHQAGVTMKGFEGGTLIRREIWISRCCGDVTACFQKNIIFRHL